MKITVRDGINKGMQLDPTKLVSCKPYCEECIFECKNEICPNGVPGRRWVEVYEDGTSSWWCEDYLIIEDD